MRNSLKTCKDRKVPVKLIASFLFAMEGKISISMYHFRITKEHNILNIQLHTAYIIIAIYKNILNLRLLTQLKKINIKMIIYFLIILFKNLKYAAM